MGMCSINVLVCVSHGTLGPMLNTGLQPSWPLPHQSDVVSAKLRKKVTLLQIVW